MAITLTSAFENELKQNVNRPNVILEVSLDGRTEKWGYHKGGFSDVKPILKSLSSLQNKIDVKRGVSSRGSLNVVISGRENFKEIIKNYYLKNRRVVRKDGFLAEGFLYSDYAETFTGKILDWSRKGDELYLVIGDDLMVTGKTKLPEVNSTKTQSLDYKNTNPVDIMLDILSNQLDVDSAFVDTVKFESERDDWLNSWSFDRVLTKPVQADNLLNELQQETNSFIIQDGEKLSYKVFSPSAPTVTTTTWSDRDNLLLGSLSIKSGYEDNFFNRIIIYYDYDESGNNKEENFENVYIALDASSQSSGEWDEKKTKTIKSKWIRSHTYGEPVNVTGVTIYNVGTANGLGAGTLGFDVTENALTWKAPGSTVAGVAVKINKSGKFLLTDEDSSKTIRVVVNDSLLPVSSQSDSIDITSLSGDSFAATLANKLLKRYRNPVATVSFAVDINDGAEDSKFIKPTDLKRLTTDEVCMKGQNGWDSEQLMLTSVRPDFNQGRINIEAVQTTIGGFKYGFTAPVGHPDYVSATVVEREWAYIGDSSNKVDGGTVDGFYII